MKIILNSYRPLCMSGVGRERAERHGIAPYVDGSIRREPDFECEYPSISGICRCNKLVGRLHKGDVVAYVTLKYGGERRLVSILEVVERFDNHGAAALWYREHTGGVPRNCMVTGNPPLPQDMAQPCQCKQGCKGWDGEYRERARKYPLFLACRAQYLELWHPPLVPEDIFGRPFPRTQTPPYLSADELSRLRALCTQAEGQGEA
jgi:hypothetical protein